MSSYSGNYEPFGTTVLTGAVIVASIVVLIAFLANTLPQIGTAIQVANAPIKQVASVAPLHARKMS